MPCKLVCHLRLFLDKRDLSTVSHAPITSRLDLLKHIYIKLPLKTVQKLIGTKHSSKTVASIKGHIILVLQNLHGLHAAFVL